MLNLFSKKIIPYIKVLADHHFGIRKRAGTITHVAKSTNLHYENGMNSFVFSLNLGKNDISWQFVFDLDDLGSPPDIIANDGFYESIDPNVVLQQVPYLGRWDATDPKCVVQLVLELLNLYQYQQMHILYHHDHLKKYKNEYERLAETVNRDDMEVSVRMDFTRLPAMEICIGFIFDISDFPMFFGARQDHMAWLTIFYQAQTRLNFTLDVGEELEQLIGKVSLTTLDLPVSPEEYVVNINQFLKSKINEVRKKLIARKRLTHALMAIDSLQILEVDDELYSKVSFFLKQSEKNIVCLVEMPNEYPQMRLNLTAFKGKPQTVNFHPSARNQNPVEVATSIVHEFKKFLGILTEPDSS